MKLNLCKSLHCRVIRGLHWYHCTDVIITVSICSNKDKDRDTKPQSFTRLFMQIVLSQTEKQTKKIRCNYFDALACREELLPAAWWHSSSPPHGWYVARRGHPVTWNGCAIFHSGQAQLGAWTKEWGAASLPSALWDTHHDAVMKDGTGYALRGSWGLFSPHMEIWRLFSLPLSSPCSFPSSSFQIRAVVKKMFLWFALMRVRITGQVCGFTPCLQSCGSSPHAKQQQQQQLSPTTSLSTTASSWLSLVMPDDFYKHRTPTNMPTLS